MFIPARDIYIYFLGGSIYKHTQYIVISVFDVVFFHLCPLHPAERQEEGAISWQGANMATFVSCCQLSKGVM